MVPVLNAFGISHSLTTRTYTIQLCDIFQRTTGWGIVAHIAVDTRMRTNDVDVVAHSKIFAIKKVKFQLDV